MAKEYKFMFDRRFDEPEEETPPAPEDLSAKSVDGIPSISQLLDTINEQIAENSEILSNDNGNEPPQNAPDAIEPVAAAEPDEPPAEETETEDGEEVETAAPKDFIDLLNPDSLTTLTGCLVEPAIAESNVGDRFQFLRMGYFCKDPDSTSEKPVFNRVVPLKDSWAKAKLA